MKFSWWYPLANRKTRASWARQSLGRPQSGRPVRLAVEALEDRTLLSFGTLPPYDATRLTQTLFGLDAARLTVSAGKTGIISDFYQFALNGQDASLAAKFDLAPADPTSTRDGALALYDSAGNTLIVADADPVPGHPGFESLTATLNSRQVYTLGVFFQAAAATDQFTVTATLGVQVAQPAIALNLATGRAPTTADTFGTPATVNYYPLNLMDAGAGASVTVTPTGLDVNAFATLFRRSNATAPWQPIASSSGNTPFSLMATPPANQSLTDAQYLLATAPVGFNTAARSYTLDVQATALLAPASISLTAVTDLLTPPPVAVGTAQVAQAGTLTVGGQQLYRFRAPSAGSATLTLQSAAFGPVVSVYDATGTNLLGVASATTPGTAALPLTVQAGSLYVVRVSAAGAQQGGAFTLTVQAPYTATNLPLNPLNGNASVTTVTGVTVGPAQGARFYRLGPAAGTNVLAIGVAPGNGASPIAAEVVLVAPNLAPVTQQVGAGQTLFLPVDISRVGGPLDLYVAGTTGSDPATLQIGQLAIPTTLALSQLQPVQLGLNGQLMAAPALAQNAGAFGGLSGVQYEQLATAAGTTTLAVQGNGGAQPLLAHYQVQGNVFTLIDYALPSANSRASFADALDPHQLQGVAAFSLGLGGSGTNTFSATTPAVTGVGVAMAPEQVPDFSHNPPIFPPCPCYSDLNINNVTLGHDYEQHLWRTVLPGNILAVPHLAFTPAATAAQMQVQVSVYYANGTLIETDLNPSDKPLNATVADLRGRTLLFRVVPVAGQPLGSGTYSLKLRVQTDNPSPFQITEQNWYFTSRTDDYNFYSDTHHSVFDSTTSSRGLLPADMRGVDVIQNQFGHGEAAGQFTSSYPYNKPDPADATNTYIYGNAGAIQVFRFWAPNPGPVVVKTVLDPSTPGLHTNLRVYKAVFDANHQVTGLQAIDSVGPSFGWYPADRSQVDAQTYINDFSLLSYPVTDSPYANNTESPYAPNPSGNLYYVVIKNQEGTLGRFKLVVDTAPMPLVGNTSALPYSFYQKVLNSQTAYIPPTTGGTIALDVYFGLNYPGLVGYFPIQVPAYHNGTLSVSSLSFDHGFYSSGRWDLALFDAAGTQLTGTVQDYQLLDRVYTSGTFTLASGAQTVYLRVRSKETTAPGNGATLNVSVGFQSGIPTPPPPTFAGSPSLLPTNPQGDGSLGDTLTQGQVKTYAFQAAPGPLTVHIAPDSAGTTQLSWGIYVNNNLIAWNQTGTDPATTTATLLLPNLRQPLPVNPDFDYDPQSYWTLLNRYATVVVYVKAVTAPPMGGHFTAAVQMNPFVAQRNLATGAPVDQASHLFTAQADSSVVLPMRNLVGTNQDLDLAINPETGNTGSSTIAIAGTSWSRLVVPAGVSGSVGLTVSVSGTQSRHISYDLYSIAFDNQGHYVGQKVAFDSGYTIVRFSLNFIAWILPATVVGGTSYYLRVGDVDNPTAQVYVRPSCSLPKDVGPLPPDTDYGIGAHPLTYAQPDPSGHFQNTLSQDPGNATVMGSDVFWVGNGGHVHLDLTISNAVDTNPTISLYQGYFYQIPEPSCGGSLRLIDFVNNAATTDHIHYSLDANLDPGMYVLRIDGHPSGASTVAVNGQLPAYIPQLIVLDPNLGTSDVPPLLATTRDDACPVFPWDPLSQYRTSFYSVVAPGGSLGGLHAAAQFLGASAGTGDAKLTVWTQSNGFTQLAQGDLINPTPSQETTAQTSAGAPGTPFWIEFSRDGLAGKVGVSATFPVPMSGLPDWVVKPIVLSANNGQTLVQVTVVNGGYGFAPDVPALLQFTDATKPPGQQLVTSMLTESGLAPFASVTHTFIWHPASPDDAVSYAVNTGTPKVAELDYTNDSQSVQLKTVDPAVPTLSFQLADPQIVGTGDPNLVSRWGRYVAGVLGVKTDITLNITGAGGLYALNLTVPPTNVPIGTYPSSVFLTGTSASYTLAAYDFGGLGPGANLLRAIVTDQYGLTNDPNAGTKIIQVVPRPNWTGWGNDSPTPIVYKADKHQYNLTYHNGLVDKGGTLSDWLGFHVPLIGGARNRFLIEITGTAVAPLAPSDNLIPATVSGHILIEILSGTGFEETYTAADTPEVTDHLVFAPKLLLDGVSLDANYFLVSLFLKDIQIAHYKSQEIPLFALGIPDVAALQANVQFGVDLKLNAGLTLVPAFPEGLGFVSPTFISPSFTASATVAGEVTVLGFHLAKLSGTVSLTLAAAYGLPATVPIVPVDQFLHTACFGLDGSLSLKLEAKVIWPVWSWKPASIPLHLGGCMVGTQGSPPPISGPDILTGNDPVGHLTIDPNPNLVIDPTTGNALYLQVVNGAPEPAVIGNLAVSQRTGGTWTPLTRLAQGNFVSQPVLAFSHDRPGTPAVTVYSALSTPGDPSGLTENQFLTSQGLRWRYYDGMNWGGEQTLLADGRYNFNPALAFNGSGQGAVAWVRNNNPAPVNNAGLFDRTSNQIEAAVWDPVNHVWRTPQALTGVGDVYNPAVYAADDGKLFVVWLQAAGGSDQIMYSIYNGSSWSAPAPLALLGLPAGGLIDEVAIGSERAGRLDVLLTYERALPDGSVEHYLYNRPSTEAGFATPTAVEIVASQANFSHLRTLQVPGGGLVAYWQQSDGITNEIFTSRIGPATTAWSPPAPLTAGNPLIPGSSRPTGTNIQFEPSVALDTDGRFQVVYSVVAAPGADPSPPRQDPPVGNPMSGGAGGSSARLFPQLAFTGPLALIANGATAADAAPSGSTVIGQAQLVNRGMAGDSVRLDFYYDSTLLGSQTISLGPGQSHLISHAFVIGSGSHTYAIRATALGGQEIIPGPHVVSATVVGLIDVAVGQVTLSDPNPHTGEALTVTGDILNLSNLAIGTPFTVAFYLGDPNRPDITATLLGTRTVNGLPANGHQLVSFPWTVPATGGNFLLTIRADSGNVLQEVTKGNNDGAVAFSILPDAALVPVRGTPPVQATVLNYSGNNNVSVTATVSNLGRAGLINVPVQVYWSLDGSTFQPVANTTIATLAAGTNTSVTFTVRGLAGHNLYRVVVDPNNTLPDADRSNNVAETMLLLQGLPDLRFGVLTLVGTSGGLGSILTVPLVNLGIAPTQKVPVEVYALNSDLSPTLANIMAHGQLLDQTIVYQVAALSSTNAVLTIATLNLPYKQLCVVVDRTNTLTLLDHMHNIASIAVPLTPAAPSNLAATAISDTQIRLTWANHAVSATQILVFRSVDGVNYVNIATVSATTATYTDANLTPGTYHYRLQTLNQPENHSDYSNVSSAAVPITPTHFSVTPSSTTPLAGTAFTITVTALTATNQTAPGYRGTVHFTSSDPQVMSGDGLPADYTFTDADQGVHTFTVILKTAGNQTVTVRDTVTTSITGTATMTVRPAAVKTLAVANFPSPTVAGAGQTFTVTALDPYGNIATGYTGTITFTTTDPQGIVPNDYTFTAADQGTHIFGGAMLTAGIQALTATDTGNAALTSTQAGIVVTPAAADHFVVATSVDGSSTVAGTPFDVTVTVQDAYGNTVPSYTGTVTFSSQDPYGAALPSNYTFQATDQGTVTFPGGATLFTAGTWDVTATDSASGISGSDNVAVMAAPAVAFVILAPSSVASGVAFDMTVMAVDPYGNIDTNYTGTVTFTTTDPDQGVVLPGSYTFSTSDSGVHTFGAAVSLVTVGDQVLTVTDMDNNLSTAVTITVVDAGGPSIRAGGRGAAQDASRATDTAAGAGAPTAVSASARAAGWGEGELGGQRRQAGDAALVHRGFPDRHARDAFFAAVADPDSDDLLPASGWLDA
jgi:hypothetical protein